MYSLLQLALTAHNVTRLSQLLLSLRTAVAGALASEGRQADSEGARDILYTGNSRHTHYSSHL
jgi:hypothetical protein